MGKKCLPRFRSMPAVPYGRCDPRVLVVHQTVGDLDDGSDAAALCVSRSRRGEAGTWHWTVGGTGDVYRHLDWNEMGAHDMGINSISNGIEHDMPYAGARPPEAMYRSSAEIAAAHAIKTGRKPSRDWIIGHDEDHRFGGDSTHTDPGETWDWRRYMSYVQEAYARCRAARSKVRVAFDLVGDPVRRARLRLRIRSLAEKHGLHASRTDPEAMFVRGKVSQAAVDAARKEMRQVAAGLRLEDRG